MVHVPLRFISLLCAVTVTAGVAVSGCGGGGDKESTPAAQTPLNPDVSAVDRNAIDAGVYGVAQVAAVATLASYPLQQLATPAGIVQNSDGSFGSCPQVKLLEGAAPIRATLQFPNCTPAGTTQVVDGIANLTVARTGEQSFGIDLALAGITVDGSPTTGDLSGDLTLQGDPRTPGSTLGGILSLAEFSFVRSGTNYSASGIVQLAFVFSGNAAHPVQTVEIGTATINSSAAGVPYVINASGVVIDPSRGTIPLGGQLIITEPNTGGAPRTSVVQFNNLSPNTGIVLVTVTEGGESRSFEYDLLP